MNHISPPASLKIDEAESAYRLAIIRAADANNRLEGIFRQPETDAIVDAYVRGEIEMSDLVKSLAAP